MNKKHTGIPRFNEKKNQQKTVTRNKFHNYTCYICVCCLKLVNRGKPVFKFFSFLRTIYIYGQINQMTFYFHFQFYAAPPSTYYFVNISSRDTVWEFKNFTATTFNQFWSKWQKYSETFTLWVWEQWKIALNKIESWPQQNWFLIWIFLQFECYYLNFKYIMWLVFELNSSDQDHLGCKVLVLISYHG